MNVHTWNATKTYYNLLSSVAVSGTVLE